MKLFSSAGVSEKDLGAKYIRFRQRGNFSVWKISFFLFAWFPCCYRVFTSILQQLVS